MKKPELIDLYTTMRRVRTFEERVAELFVREGTAGSMLHLSIGEEVSSALCLLLNKGDTITSNHRGHGVFLARGPDPKRMMAEIAGKKSGYCRGKGGSMHIADKDFGSHGANAIVGGGIPHNVGAAYAYKYTKQKRLSVAFFGDGALQQGILYESMNMAALWKLPVVFVCINNQYGMGTHIRQASASLEFCERAKTFGLDAIEVDGSDVESAISKALPIFEAARKGKPAMVLLNCYRFFGHARMDKSPYRDEAEEIEGRKLDPIAKARKKLEKTVGKKKLDSIDEKIVKEMDAAVEAAIEDDYPEIEELFDGVYDETQQQPERLRERIAQIYGK